jgi:hypothetical protein
MRLLLINYVSQIGEGGGWSCFLPGKGGDKKSFQSHYVIYERPLKPVNMYALIMEKVDRNKRVQSKSILGVFSLD